MRCRFCKSNETVKSGFRYNKHRKKQVYFCKGCGCKFVPDDGFLHMRYHPRTITKAMRLWFKGLSLRKVADEFKFHFTSLWRWLIKFSFKVSRYVDRLKPKLSKRWHADEMVLKFKKLLNWNWEVMDYGTRFWLSFLVTEGWERELYDARTVLSKAKAIGGIPPFLITDGLYAYIKARRKVFGWKHNIHIRCYHEEKFHNNIMERKMGTTRERVKVLRGFKSFRTSNILMDGIRVHYNFVRDHMSLGMTPAKAAGIELNLGRNRWLSLIRRSVRFYVIRFYLSIMQHYR